MPNPQQHTASGCIKIHARRVPDIGMTVPLIFVGHAALALADVEERRLEPAAIERRR
jgi:hypothetical protein